MLWMVAPDSSIPQYWRTPSTRRSVATIWRSDQYTQKADQVGAVGVAGALRGHALGAGGHGAVPAPERHVTREDGVAREARAHRGDVEHEVVAALLGAGAGEAPAAPGTHVGAVLAGLVGRALELRGLPAVPALASACALGARRLGPGPGGGRLVGRRRVAGVAGVLAELALEFGDASGLALDGTRVGVGLGAEFGDLGGLPDDEGLEGLEAGEQRDDGGPGGHGGKVVRGRARGRVRGRRVVRSLPRSVQYRCHYGRRQCEQLNSYLHLIIGNIALILQDYILFVSKWVET